MFDLTTRWWTWLTGSKNSDQSGVYGSAGVQSPTNVPGARYLLSMVNDEANRAIYMFGGVNLDAGRTAPIKLAKIS